MNQINFNGNSEPDTVQNAYRNLMFLAFFLHAVFLFLFFFLRIHALFYYNAGSVLFYLIILFFVKKQCYRLVVAATHLEVGLFVTVSVLWLGWTPGFALYLIPMASLVYFCPYRNKYIPYIFSVMEFLLFSVLKFCTDTVFTPLTSAESDILRLLYQINCFSCFSIILISAYLSKIRAEVTRRELENENEYLSIQAHYDQLTSLYNRTYLYERLKTKEYRTIAIALGDIDDFKLVNDRWGHKYGDYVLQSVSHLMNQFSSDQTDICRWGGEEFVLVFYDIAEADVRLKIDQISQLVKGREFTCHGMKLRITMTFGISYGTSGDNISRLIEEADHRMYQGKSLGKDKIIEK